MKASFLAVAVLATIAISSAVDDVCVQRKVRGLAAHWPNPADCSSFYRCTNKNVKRELLCPEGKEYNPKTGRCASIGKNLCKLSLIAPLADSTNPCADAISGSFVAKEGSCRSFNICNENVAYPQNCDAGSYFNTVISACEPDTATTCWENFCVTKVDGTYLANDDDCYSFYICYDKNTVAQQCPTGSYFNKDSLNCQPGVCPSDTTTPSPGTDTTTCTEEITTTCTEEVTTPTTCTEEITTPTTCTEEVTTPTTCTEEVTTPTTCTEEVTTPTTCTEEITTPTTCTEEITTPTTCTEEVTTPTTCTEEVTTPSTEACTAETTTTCGAEGPEPYCDSNICLNADDNAVFPALSTNAGFCLCLNHLPEYRACGDDAIFDANVGVCVAQSKICPSINCLNQADYYTFPAANTTAGFCRCLNNEATYYDCPDTGYIYDTTLNICVKSSADDCEEELTPASSTSSLQCVGGYSEGDFVANSDNCNLFYICFEGVLEEISCGSGNYFDTTLNVCLPDTDGKCAQSLEARRNKRSIKAQNCTDGDMSADPENCEQFFICCNGEQVLEECGTGNYFNPATKTCEKDVNNVCLPKPECTCPGGYVEGEFSPHPIDCDKYYVCSEGKQVLGECGKNNYFNNETLSCEEDIDNICWPSCTCPGGYEAGQLSPHPLECDKYYICQDGKQILQACGTNNFFNNKTLTCEADTKFVCWANECLGQNNGTLVANPQQCNAFFLCEKETPVAGQCEDNLWFDPSLASCQPDINAVCYNPCETNSTINLLPHPECNKYYFCNGPQTIVGTCPSGGFDAALGICNSQISCSDNNCTGQPDGFAYASPDDPTQFYVCLSGVPILRTCPPNHEFNGFVCLPVSDPDCDSTKCKTLGFDQAFQTISKQENAFCYCKNGVAIKNYCQNDMIFNNAIGVCFSNAPCDPTICQDSPEYTVSPNRNDTQSFCLCVSEEQVIVDCPNNGTFNPFTLLCTDVEMSTECDQLQCIAQENNHIFAPINKTDNGFCLCVDHIANYRPCGPDSTFNPTFLVCLQTNINCNSTQCVGLDDATRIPSITTTQGYCECNNGTATFNLCPSSGEFNVTTQECIAAVCDPEQCATAENGFSFPATNTTKGFCFCIDSEVEYRDCIVGQEFNEAVGVCMAPLPNCEDSMCDGLPDDSALAAWTTQYGFCLCTGGLAEFVPCPTNHIFNSAVGVCLVNVELLCGKSTRCDTCFVTNSCTLYPANNATNGYCECMKDVGPNFVQCPPYYEFSANTLTCIETAASKCDVDLCANATLENPITSPALTGNTSFCYCSGPNDIMLIDCPDGKYYDDDAKLCISNIVDSCSCPDGLVNGDIVADESTCNKYFVCTNGVMVENTCDAGQYFNTDSMRCCVDTSGTCSGILITPFSCLGAYHEGERLEHPINAQMYYVCLKSVLHERNCGVGSIFDKNQNQCIKAPRIKNRFPQKRSVDSDNEFLCLENEKRSVPSNCSQYEICLNQTWKRRSCTNFRYYNPEQQKCLEPRDDLVCLYAKVANLPTCNDEMEHQLYKGKTCQQYYRCQKGKWRLKTCPKQQYFNNKLATCLQIPKDEEKLQCETLGNETVTIDLKIMADETCHHLTQRYYEANCAMYLLCLENEWWYQYCPQGMYFNRSLNYCIPDLNHECPHVLRKNKVVIIEEFNNETCTQDGLLRPSALACNRYFICMKGKWQMQHCQMEEFYDVSHDKCSLDTEGICKQLNSDCLPEEKRSYSLNCFNYEQCSLEGKWLKFECPLDHQYDDLLKECVRNTGLCSKHGYKRACKLEESQAVEKNCSMFYYCSEDTWNLGNCLKGFMYSQEKQTCLPHSLEDTCKPFTQNTTSIQLYAAESDLDLCKGQFDGVSVGNPSDCTHYYICVQEKPFQDMQCAKGSYFESSVGYCRPNNGACRLPLTGVCENASDESLVAHPTDCQSYYKCSTINGTELLQCPEGEYFHKYIRQCRIDHGECKQEMAQKCFGMEHGTRLAHELYCNIYYACVKGLAIPVECPENYQFNAILGKCVYDAEQQCLDGQLDGNITSNCGNVADGTYIPDRSDCTRYYICTLGQALHKKCSGSTYFDSELLLCVPDDGSCPYVDDDIEQNHPVPPDPIVCEDKHGYLMPDPFNCNNFYACIHRKLKHERCYNNQFFNTTISQCQLKPDSATDETELPPTNSTKLQTGQCSDSITSLEKLCSELTVGSTFAEPQDCRYYVTCQEEGEKPLSQRCRNGESYDSLLGFCRQNDGTCLLESGQRVGECSDKHGQFARDVNNCRNYFLCINGQKIAQSCRDDEYYNKSQNMCVKDTLKTCNPNQQPEEQKQSCNGLSESILYPYVQDNCRSYFQCVKGVAKIHQCADDLYFDPITIKCVKEKTECTMMPAQSLQRTPELAQSFSKLCSNKEFDHPYVNLENQCRSFYYCHHNGEVHHELCPLGMMFNKEYNICMKEELVNCH